MPTAAEIGDRMRKELERQLKALELDLDRELRRGTPVDTGHLRRNWIPSVTQPVTSEAAGEEAHAAGVARVLQYKLEDGPLWMANPAPYARFVDRRRQFISQAIDRALVRAQARARGPVDMTTARAAFQQQVAAQGVVDAFFALRRDEERGARGFVRGLRALRGPRRRRR
jgi:hypothetical protein